MNAHRRGTTSKHFPTRFKDIHLQYTTTQDESKALPFITSKEAMDMADKLNVPTTIKTIHSPLGDAYIITCGRYAGRMLFLHEIKPKQDTP